MNTREYLDVFNSLPSDGWLTCEEGLVLVSYAELTSGQMVEVGSYMGRSACLLGRLAQDHKPLDMMPWSWRRLYCIDPWDDSFSTDYRGDEIYARFLENVRGLDVVPVRKRVEDAPAISAEFIYLDGDHTYEGTVRQIAYAHRCNPRFVAIHDVNDTGGGAEVKRAALFVLGPWKERVGRVAVWEVKR